MGSHGGYNLFCSLLFTIPGRLPRPLGRNWKHIIWCYLIHMRLGISFIQLINFRHCLTLSVLLQIMNLNTLLYVGKESILKNSPLFIINSGEVWRRTSTDWVLKDLAANLWAGKRKPCHPDPKVCNIILHFLSKQKIIFILNLFLKTLIYRIYTWWATPISESRHIYIFLLHLYSLYYVANGDVSGN